MRIGQPAFRHMLGAEAWESAALALLPEGWLLINWSESNGGVASCITGLLRRSRWPPWLEVAMPLLALVAEFVANEFGTGKRLDLLAVPLLGTIAWNLFVYAREQSTSTRTVGFNDEVTIQIGESGGTIRMPRAMLPCNTRSCQPTLQSARVRRPRDVTATKEAFVSERTNNYPKSN